LSDLDENRINDINDKMCLFHLEYLMVKTTFNKFKKRLNKVYFFKLKINVKLTFFSRKHEDQQELVILLVHAVNYDFRYL